MKKEKDAIQRPVERVVKLKPCPFCGYKRVKIIHDGANWNKGVECTKCAMNMYFFKPQSKCKKDEIPCNVGLYEKTPEAQHNAIAKCWNRRVQHTMVLNLKLNIRICENDRLL